MKIDTLMNVPMITEGPGTDVCPAVQKTEKRLVISEKEGIEISNAALGYLPEDKSVPHEDEQSAAVSADLPATRM